MTFEEWMRRPVHVVMSYTASIHQELGLPIGHMRLRRAYRCADAQTGRDAVAAVVRHRRAKGLTFEDVRIVAEARRDMPGIAVRVDIDTELRRMEGNKCLTTPRPPSGLSPSSPS